MTEYGRIHTDGSRSGGQPVVDNAMLDALQKDAGLPHLPTQETYQFRMAVSGEGPLAYQWSDKPHRLLYDACSIIEREAALRTYSNAAAAGFDRIGGAGVVPHGVVGVATQDDALQAENKQLRHDLERQMSIANEHVNEVDTLLREIETLRVEALAERLRGYYEGCANPIVQHDALRDALVDLLHAVCGQTGFVETVRRDSGRIYPWPALDLAEAKAIAALEQSK